MLDPDNRAGAHVESVMGDTNTHHPESRTGPSAQGSAGSRLAAFDPAKTRPSFTWWATRSAAPRTRA